MSEIKLEEIADIFPPTAPVTSLVNSWVILFLFMLITITAVIYYYRSEKQQLKRLQIKYKQHAISQRQFAFKLAELLKQKHPDKVFHSKLQAACFSRHGIDESSMEELISRAEQWI